MSQVYKNKEGSAIIIALIISIIAMSLSLYAIKMSKNINFTSKMLICKLYAKVEADSTIEKLKFYISTGNFKQNYVESSTKGLPSKLYLDSRVQNIGNTTISIQDAGGLENVISLSPYVIANLLKQDNISESHINIIKNSITDWIDKDNKQKVGGAESSYYETHGFKYAPRNFNGFQSIYELNLIRGLDDNKTFKKIEKYLILSPTWSFNVNTASANMLSAFLDIPLNVAIVLVNIRNKKGYLTFKDLYMVTGKNFSNPYSNITTLSTYTLKITIISKYEQATQKTSCVIDFSPTKTKPFYTLKWSDGN